MQDKNYKQISVFDLLNLELTGQNSLNIKCIAGRSWLSKTISIADINRPGLALSGFFESFAYQRVQLFGRGEYAYLQKLQAEDNFETIKQFFAYDIPCVIFTHGLMPSETFLSFAETNRCPVLQTDLESTDFSQRLLRFFSNWFAPRKTIHGVFVEVFGVGILLQGSSGIGKSETALELLDRGHRLVADDSVELRCVNGNTIIGEGPRSFFRHHMEIRGLGIVNISHLYGVGAVREQKEVQMIIRLQPWDSEKELERTGLNNNTVEYLGVKIPLLEISVKPGRNLPIIVEAAAMNARLKNMGFNSSEEFSKNVMRGLEADTARRLYFKNEDLY